MFENLMYGVKEYMLYHSGAATYTANNSVAALRNIFGYRIITRLLWPAYSLTLSACDDYL